MFARLFSLLPLGTPAVLLVAVLAMLALTSSPALAQEGQLKTVPPDHAERAKAGMQLFQEKVRDLLVTHCLDCHGGESIKGDFDLRTRQALMDSGHVGETADESYLMELIRHEAEPAMPLKSDKLSDEAIEQIARWIDLGAVYEKPLVDKDPASDSAPMQVSEKDRQYWAFQRLREVAVPAETRNDPSWGHNEIDAFIYHSLQQAGLTPSGQADRATLLRRAKLDLLGLPPTTEELDAFLRDDSEDAYEQMIDRLLRSPHYGERWARHWLDVARFAESSGFEHDYNRQEAWHYRDFLIEAFNADMPWDEMVRWQIAGDELAPHEPLAWKATGFLAAGAFPTQLTETEFESARYDELDDVVGTIGVAFLGLSTGCARCHDHKFDPIPASDYYRLVANFATTIRSIKSIEVQSEETAKRLAEWEEKTVELTNALSHYERATIDPGMSQWIQDGDLPPLNEFGDWSILEPTDVVSRDGATLTRRTDGSWLASGNNPASDEYRISVVLAAGTKALRLEAFADPSLPQNGPGRASNGNFGLGNLTLQAVDPQQKLPHFKSARATHQQNENNLSVASSIDSNPDATGWAVDFGGIGKDQAAVFVFDEPLASDAQVVLTMRFHVNGQHSLGCFRWAVSADEAADYQIKQGVSQYLADGVKKIYQFRNDGVELQLSEPEQQAIRQWYAQRDSQWKTLQETLATHQAAKPAPQYQSVLVYSEGVKPLQHHADDRGYPHFYPQVHQLLRGAPKAKGEVAAAGFLDVLTPSDAAIDRWQALPEEPSPGLSYRRAQFAGWLTDHQQGAGHLLARVIVNRVWQHHFGRGIVGTPNDFGIQGESPSHPELLEWLASDLVKNGWQLKRLHRLIMTSATYRQCSRPENAPLTNDSENRLLRFFPSRRLEGEAIRDSMLLISGQLDPQMYGPGTLDENMRRRSVYFFIKRSQPVAMMQVFDWPEHLVSIGQRSRTTIAPQALALLNSPQVRAYAEAVAIRLREATVKATGEALDFANDKLLQTLIEQSYRMIYARLPEQQELDGAVNFLRQQQQVHGGNGAAKQQAIIDYCHALMNSNEFLYLP